MEIKGKTALVTGGAKRIGRAIAIRLAQKGAQIALHFHSSEPEAQKTAEEIQGLGVSCRLFRADLSEPDQIRSMVGQLEASRISIDFLVNSASVFEKTPLSSVAEEDWDRHLNTNLKGPFFLSKELGLRMAERGGGKIINIADWSGARPYKDYAPYCASKGGLLTLTKALARDLAPGVLVNAVAPGPVLEPPAFSQEERQIIARSTALGRWGKPEDIAAAVCFLLENDFMNGTILVVDGGRSIV